MKVLIVDNDDVSLYTLQLLLVGNGYDVVATSNGKEALERLSDGDIDLIISDILMPVMDGFALCSEVRKNASFQHIPFIVYTATYTSAQDEDLALEIGANRFIVKPCDPDIFVNVVHDMIEDSKQQDYYVKPSIKTEGEVLKLYNERLVRKLEQKLLQAQDEVTARKIALEALHRSDDLLNATQIISKIGGWECDIKNSEIFWSQETYRIHDIEPEDIDLKGGESIQKSIQCYDEQDRPLITEAFGNCVESGIPYEIECSFTTFKGRKLFIRTNGKAVYEGDKIVKVFGSIQDITERKKNAIEQIKLKEQLLQAQKLESIGQLAGGIAHDFNNILTVILGYSEEILRTLQAEDPLSKDIEEIVKAGKRALSLTRQLLAFSRKHVIQPQVILINVIIKELNKMLFRLIGEDIEFISVLADDLGYIKADGFQIEQVIMNLVINAREAMPAGGKLRIETANVVLGNESTEDYIGMKPGKYIMLSISDTGCGMDKATSDRIFEPFFTTKQLNRGTGLGLSMVYGILTQSEGFIRVYSEPGIGTTFKIFLPQTDEKPDIRHEEPAVTELLGNGEQIVVVEDDPAIGSLIKKMIEKLGYRVTVFENAEAAIADITDNSVIPDMVITDVVMPGMNGKEMADHLHKSLPDLKVLFMSGYTDSIIFHHGVLEPGIPYIQKPFSRESIALHIRQLLTKERQAPWGNKQILMIDDDTDIQVIYKRSLTKKGYQVVCCENLDSALATLSQQVFKVILVDINIPGTDGMSIIKAIREAGYSTPVIVLSGDIQNIDIQDIRTMGVVCALEKSNVIQPLIDEIERIEAL